MFAELNCFQVNALSSRLLTKFKNHFECDTIVLVVINVKFLRNRILQNTRKVIYDAVISSTLFQSLRSLCTTGILSVIIAQYSLISSLSAAKARCQMHHSEKKYAAKSDLPTLRINFSQILFLRL